MRNCTHNNGRCSDASTFTLSRALWVYSGAVESESLGSPEQLSFPTSCSYLSCSLCLVFPACRRVKEQPSVYDKLLLRTLGLFWCIRIRRSAMSRTAVVPNSCVVDRALSSLHATE